MCTHRISEACCVYTVGCQLNRSTSDPEGGERPVRFLIGGPGGGGNGGGSAGGGGNGSGNGGSGGDRGGSSRGG